MKRLSPSRHARQTGRVCITGKFKVTGVEEIVQLDLEESELDDLGNSANDVRKMVEVLHS